MRWCTTALVIIAVMAGVIGFADNEAEAPTAMSALYVLFVCLFGFCFFVLLRPHRGRHGSFRRRTHSRHG